MLRRCLLSAALAFVLAVSQVSDGTAGQQWCEWDPVVLVETPGGSTVPVYVTSAVPDPRYVVQLMTAEMSYTAEPTPLGSATHVHLFVRIPQGSDGTFPTRSTASSGPLKTGVIYAEAAGWSGHAMEMVFTLPVP